MANFRENFSLKELDGMGYWRRSLRRRGREAVEQISGEAKYHLAATWHTGRRNAAKDRLRKRRPDITEAAIRDMVVNHLLRDSDWEAEIAARWKHRCT